MAKINILSVNADTSEMTLIMAAVGAADLAVEKARQLGARSDDVRAHVIELPTDMQTQIEKLMAEVQALPKNVKQSSEKARARAQKQVEELAARGEDLVDRIQHDSTTEALVHQAESAVAKSKGVVTSARNAAKDTRRAATSTLTTGRREAAQVAEVVIDSLEKDAAKTLETVKASASRTRSSAQDTAATAKEAAARTTRSAKAATTSARKTGAAARKSAATTAEQIGD